MIKQEFESLLGFMDIRDCNNQSQSSIWNMGDLGYNKLLIQNAKDSGEGFKMY